MSQINVYHNIEEYLCQGPLRVLDILSSLTKNVANLASQQKVCAVCTNKQHLVYEIHFIFAAYWRHYKRNARSLVFSLREKLYIAVQQQLN